MTKESIIHLGSENVVRASRLEKKEKIPMTDKRLEMILQSITKDIVIVSSFFLAGKILPDADIFKTFFILLFAVAVIWLYMFYEKGD